MNQGDDATTCWTTRIMALSAELGWGWSPKEVADCLSALHARLLHGMADVKFRKACIDYWTVQALLDHGHPAHNDQWRYWMQRALEVLRKRGMAWSSDAAVDVDDFNQMAQEAFLGSLKKFNYESSLDTWVHSVVVRSINRHVRDSLAQKRGQRPESLNNLSDGDLPLEDNNNNDDPAQSARNRIVIDQASKILFEYGGERLVLVFLWYTVDLYTTTEIANKVNLHPSRVRALLTDARKVLRNHPEMQAWR